MAWFSRTPALPAFPRTGHSWAVVDVETSGVSSAGDRVLSLAVMTLDRDGRHEQTFTTLLDPGCDPGPVHIHGLTRQRLAGSPRFADVLPRVQELLEGRVLVAHNAAFDHGFLSAEAQRCGAVLAAPTRLCTLTLSRRLGLPVADYRLGTLAAHWGVQRRRAHDAEDDARVLVGVLHRTLVLAGELEMPLPVVDVRRRTEPPARPPRVVRVPCPWENPGRLQPGGHLVQGMVVVITGPVSCGREVLAERLQQAGLDVANSVSRHTSLLVSNDPHATTAKARRARRDGVPVVAEALVSSLLAAVAPGRARNTTRGGPRPAGTEVTVVERPRSIPVATGPWAGQRVLVVGGTHADARAARDEVGTAGAAAAINLTASVTHLLLLPGGERDARVARAREHGVPAVRLPDLAAPPAQARARGTGAPPVLVRGQVVDLPRDLRTFTVTASWRASGDATDEIDVVALLLDADEQVSSDDDLVFYHSPTTEDGAVELAEDGTSEQSVRIDLDRLRPDCARIVVAAVVNDGRAFGDVGAVEVALDSAVGGELTATVDAGTTERTMVLAEIYHRRDAWRARVVGQGYDDGLAELATRHGVEVDD